MDNSTPLHSNKIESNCSDAFSLLLVLGKLCLPLPIPIGPIIFMVKAQQKVMQWYVNKSRSNALLS
ncbi:hypothetical protein BDV33DRAFT_185167 [Aspergillus novoparasiticus]|uniref:Uncharacterized protein n=1 Tax=Aspergillus novoparasiticus TaxID=986946 RepID=A0A5N6E9Y6_9EURO|nr:hypothetical protein BDV33DRAFT_185167 [Aspergillus novoparasiticus]